MLNAITSQSPLDRFASESIDRKADDKLRYFIKTHLYFLMLHSEEGISEAVILEKLMNELKLLRLARTESESDTNKIHLFRAGCKAEDIYIIRTGELRVEIPQNGCPAHDVILKEGKIVGEMALFEDQNRRNADVILVGEEAELIRISFKTINEIFEANRDPTSGEIPLKELMRHLQGSRARLNQLLAQPYYTPSDLEESEPSAKNGQILDRKKVEFASKDISEWVSGLIALIAKNVAREKELDLNNFAISVFGGIGKKIQGYFSDCDFLVTPKNSSYQNDAQRLTAGIHDVLAQMLDTFSYRGLDGDKILIKEYFYLSLCPDGFKHTYGALDPFEHYDIDVAIELSSPLPLRPSVAPSVIRDLRFCTGNYEIFEEFKAVANEKLYGKKRLDHEKAILQELEDLSISWERYFYSRNSVRGFNVKQSGTRVVDTLSWLVRSRQYSADGIIHDLTNPYELFRHLADTKLIEEDAAIKIQDSISLFLQIRDRLHLLASKKDKKDSTSISLDQKSFIEVAKDWKVDEGILENHLLKSIADLSDAVAHVLEKEEERNPMIKENPGAETTSMLPDGRFNIDIANRFRRIAIKIRELNPDVFLQP